MIEMTANCAELLSSAMPDGIVKNSDPYRFLIQAVNLVKLFSRMKPESSPVDGLSLQKITKNIFFAGYEGS